MASVEVPGKYAPQWSSDQLADREEERAAVERKPVELRLVLNVALLAVAPAEAAMFGGIWLHGRIDAIGGCFRQRGGVPDDDELRAFALDEPLGLLKVGDDAKPEGVLGLLVSDDHEVARLEVSIKRLQDAVVVREAKVDLLVLVHVL
eukprot:7379017-Prymnesium_polylepis.3